MFNRTALPCEECAGSVNSCDCGAEVVLVEDGMVILCARCGLEEESER